MKNTESYRKEIAWWFAELGRESEVEQYLSLFPMLNSRLAKYAVCILLWNMTGKIKISHSEDVARVKYILHCIDESSLFDRFDNTFNEQTPAEVEQIISGYDKIISISVNEQSFPQRLRDIGIDCPSIIYCRGNIELLNRDRAVAIIGARVCDQDGYNMAFNLAEHYARDGYVIVSGLALGCDTAAHKGALAANGMTIAVVATGLDRVHPRENELLQNEILFNGGLIISEQPIGVKANPTRLVARNRIQAALSDAVILAQCPAKSGSLYTMEFARKYGKLCYVATYPARTPANAGNYLLLDSGQAQPILPEGFIY